MLLLRSALLAQAQGMRMVLNPAAFTALMNDWLGIGQFQVPGPLGGSIVFPRFHPYVVAGSCANAAAGTTSRHAIAIILIFIFFFIVLRPFLAWKFCAGVMSAQPRHVRSSVNASDESFASKRMTSAVR